MNQTRTFLILAWLMVAVLLWMEWNKEQVAPPVPEPVAATATAGASSVPAAPAVAPAAGATVPNAPAVPLAPGVLATRASARLAIRMMRASSAWIASTCSR